jgi:ribosomal-protein-alanine N-acetyltransferase
MKILLEQFRTKFPEFFSARLQFRRIVATDAEALYQQFSDPEVMQYYNQYAYTTMQQATEVVSKLEDGFQAGFNIRWAIVPKGETKLVGTIGFFADITNPHTGELGYELNRNHWRKGLITEAIDVVTAFGLNTIHLKRIQARTVPENIASWKALEKNQFTREGLLRKQGWWKNELHDVFLYARIANT